MNVSRRTKRMLIHQARNKSSESLNLIPLIDILSVLVSFLLVYSTEVEIIRPSADIQLPESVARQKPSETVVVTIGGDAIRVQGETIVTLAAVDRSSALVIPPLKKALLAQHAAFPAVDGRRELTIVGDKEIPYRLLKKVLATCTDADYTKVSLAVSQMQAARPAAAEG